MKTSGVLLFLGITFLLLIGIQGNLIMRNRRCLCIDFNQKKIQVQALKDLQQFVPSPSCEKMEIIATLKNGDKTCLNPDLSDVKKLVKDWEKKVNQKQKQNKIRKYKKPKKMGKSTKSQGAHKKTT
ncbi:PREDICTED: c-X-C motif chemokine 9 [Elephantulus edwardii]|uniref:c-X-C motif chemokine 9 n=1 Tax=Elephantulus edwardii TaxID=28737 RepID=UPI0003F0BF45|nr:PREDICTED: c-X-C motif chemokine 9 [Elephantulus edwardii]